MNSGEKWQSLKVRSSQYESLQICAEATGRSIISLGEEALKHFITKVAPIYIADAKRTRATIERKLKPARPRQKKGPRRTQMGPIETVSIAS